MQSKKVIETYFKADSLGFFSSCSCTTYAQRIKKTHREREREKEKARRKSRFFFNCGGRTIVHPTDNARSKMCVCKRRARLPMLNTSVRNTSWIPNPVRNGLVWRIIPEKKDNDRSQICMQGRISYFNEPATNCVKNKL